jgi:adenylate cyclase
MNGIPQLLNHLFFLILITYITRSTPACILKPEKSIVVLPFQNMSSDPENEYFADGVTEELINALSKIQGLKVTARTSSFAYKNKPKDVRIIGEELGVSTALQGSIRKSGNRIRVSAQLSRTDNGFQVWADRYDRSLTDIFELQDEISLLIADQIRENFGHLEIHEHLITSPTENIEAYALYLKGRFYQLQWNFNDFGKSIKAYESSIELDPGFFPPYYGLVQSYGLMASWGFMDREAGIRKADYYLRKGLRINDQISAAHFALATKSLWVDWKPHEALSHLEKALSINPNDSEALESAAECHIALGQFEEANAFIDKALEVNPLSANHHFTQGNIYYLQEAYQKALACFDKSLQIDPTWELSLQVRANCYILMGKRAALNELLKEHPELTEGQLFVPLYDAVNHGKPIVLSTLPTLKNVYFPWSLWTLIYADQPAEALQQLSASVEERLGPYLNFQREPLNKPLRSLESYKALCKSVFDAPLSEGDGIESPASNELMPKEAQRLYTQKLEQLMHDEQMYTVPSLTLRHLAEEMDLHANKLSWLINVVIGKNFNEYINGLRVEAFKKKALEPAFENYSILSIAFECGFNSKSVFNDFFKKSEGITPTAWLKSQKT